jgi:hypothetical protein
LFGRSVELDVEFQKFVHTSARTMTCWWEDLIITDLIIDSRQIPRYKTVPISSLRLSLFETYRFIEKDMPTFHYCETLNGMKRKASTHYRVSGILFLQLGHKPVLPTQIQVSHHPLHFIIPYFPDSSVSKNSWIFFQC